MIKNLNRLIALLLIASIAVVIGCKKETALTVPPAQAHFAADANNGTYFITGPTVTYTLPIGTTDVADVDRTINVTVTSPTGAVQGTHYTLSKTSVVIPAGKALDSIVVRGVQSQYLSGRKDTLIFTIQESGVPVASFGRTFTLAMRGPCFEGDVDLNLFKGDYTKTNELWGTNAYGPYKTSITAVNPLTPTTGTITVTNIFDDGWNPLVFTLDWTDPNNRKITLVTQNAGSDASHSFGATYAGIPFGVRPASTGEVGTFSICNQTLILRMQVGVFGVGYSGNLYTLTMVR